MSALEHTDDLIAFVEASPASYHAAAEGGRRLAEAGFAEQDEAEPWDSTPGGHYLIRDGAFVGWRIPEGVGPTSPYRILGSHTDSPTFKLKPQPDSTAYGWQQVGVEVYGGPLLNSWLDRELGLAGRLTLRDGRTLLVQSGPMMRIPQLAIHLDRNLNDEGLKLNKQTHTAPVWGVGHPDVRVLAHLAELAGVDTDEVDGHDVLAFDTQTPRVFGPNHEFLASRRLDNLSSVHASVVALVSAAPSEAIEMVVACDHEELGSESRSGAAGPLLSDVTARISHGLGADVEQRHQALARSICLSADAGHAIHPNYPERHDPVTRPVLNAGPLLKLNANQRYATDALGAAVWRRACRAAGAPTQDFVSNNAMPCGSTIGPLTATRLGIQTVDVGVPLLSMHSARELAGTEDPYWLTLAMQAFLTDV